MTNNLKIEVSISGVKTYVGRITGTDEQYGFALEFLGKSKISRTLHRATITEPGLYRVSDGAVIKDRRIDTGFVTVSEDGTVTEIEKSEALAIINKNKQ